MSTKKKPTQLDRIEHRLALVEISLDVLRSGATFMQELDRAKAAPIDQSHLVNMLEKEIDSFIMMPGGTRWFMERMPKDLVSKNPRLCDAIVEYVTTLEGKRAAPQPEGLQPGDYTDASKEVADALTAMKPAVFGTRVKMDGREWVVVSHKPDRFGYCLNRATDGDDEWTNNVKRNQFTVID